MVNNILWEGDLSDEDKIRAHQFSTDCFSLLFDDESFGFYHSRMSLVRIDMARLYYQLGKYEQMFDCIEKSVEHAVKYDTRASGNYTAFMANHIYDDVDRVFKSNPRNTSADLMTELQNERYAQFKDDARMKAIIAKLEPVAQF